MLRLLLIGLVVAMMSAVWSTEAMAQRDAGAKARGEFGTGFWNPKNPRSNANTSQATEAYRRYSYEPTAQAAEVQPQVTSGQPVLGRLFRRRIRGWSAERTATQPILDRQAEEGGYRSFSYEPARQTYRSQEQIRDPWTYLRTDPRRYRQ